MIFSAKEHYGREGRKTDGLRCSSEIFTNEAKMTLVAGANQLITHNHNSQLGILPVDQAALRCARAVASSAWASAWRPSRALTRGQYLSSCTQAMKSAIASRTAAA